MKTAEKDLKYFLELSYPVRLVVEPDGAIVASIEELPGCLSQGESADDAMCNIEEARQLWIETAWERGISIPEPSTNKEYSGKVLLRMPRCLHRRVANTAMKEGISLNQYLVYLLSTRQGCKETFEFMRESIPELIKPEIHDTFIRASQFYQGSVEVRGLPRKWGIG